MKKEQLETKDFPKNLITRETESVAKMKDGETDREVEETKAIKMTCNNYFIFANIILMSV